MSECAKFVWPTLIFDKVLNTRCLFDGVRHDMEENGMVIVGPCPALVRVHAVFFITYEEARLGSERPETLLITSRVLAAAATRYAVLNTGAHQ